MSTTNIKVETVPNELIRLFHVRNTLTDITFNWVAGSGKQIEGIAGILAEIRGVESLCVNPYYLRVEIAQAYDWEEVEPKVLAILREFQGELG